MEILVVDDCGTVRTRIKQLVSSWGDTPILVSDPLEVCRMCEQGEIPRIIVMDWVMPNMEGPELIYRIRQQDPDRNKYIIMLTAKSGVGVLEKTFQCGADDYLPKPVDAEELKLLIDRGKSILKRHDEVMAASLKSKQTS